MTTENWWVDALCAEVGGDFWVPEPGGDAQGQVRQARKICAECPVADACLEDSLTHSLPGVYAGTTLREREAIKRARRADAA